MSAAMRGRAARLKTAGLVLLLAASPAIAQPADPTGMWEGRWRMDGRQFEVAEDIVGLPPGDRQLRLEGNLEARFDFCVAKDGTITGAGTAKVKRNGSSKLVKPVQEYSHGSQSERTYAPTEADGPVRVLGQRQGEEFRLYLESPTRVASRSTVELTDFNEYGEILFNGSASNTDPIPLLLFLPIISPLHYPGVTIPARDGAGKETKVSDTRLTGWRQGFSQLTEHRTRVQIRRPRADLEPLPILLEQVFKSEDAELTPDGEASLETILPRLRCAGSTQILVVVKDTGDEIFTEVLGGAREDALWRWFRENGVDPASIDWKHATGPEDDVQVSFE